MAALQARRMQWALGLVAAGFTMLALLNVHWLATVLALGAISIIALNHPAVVAMGVVLSVPVQSEVMLPFVRGEITLTQLMLFGLIAGWGIIFWKRRIWLDSITVGFLLVIAAFIVSFMVVDATGPWLQETYRWAVAGVFYVICRSVLTQWRHVRWLLWVTTATVFGVSIYALLQYFGGLAPDHFYVAGQVRVYATFGTPNTLAAYLEMTVPLLLACLPMTIWGSQRKTFARAEMYLFAISAGMGLMTIGLTQSRGGWVGIAAACLIIWLQIPGKTKWLVSAAAVVVVGGFLLTAPGQSQLERFLDTFEETGQTSEISGQSGFAEGAGRSSVWGAARAMIMDHPLTGVGAGQFDERYREYTPEWRDRWPLGQAHNVWLQMGAQAGIWGIVAFAWWFSATLWSVITARRRLQSGREQWILTGVLAVLVAYSLHSLVDYLNVLSLGLQLSVLTAIALNLAPEPLTRYQTETNTNTSPPSSMLEPSLCQ